MENTPIVTLSQYDELFEKYKKASLEAIDMKGQRDQYIVIVRFLEENLQGLIDEIDDSRCDSVDADYIQGQLYHLLECIGIGEKQI